MDEKLREKLVAGIEKAVLTAGAGNYEEGIETARRLIKKIYENLEQLRTLDEMRAVLDGCPEVSKLEGATALFVVNHLPQLVRIGLKFMAEKAASTFPGTLGGRPRVIPLERTGEVLDYVALLHRKGCSFDAAIKRTALKFGSSERTIQRLWAKRDEILDDEPLPTVDMEQAILYLKNGPGSD